LGAKNKFLDNRIQTTAAAFYYDYKNIQVSHVDAVRGSVKQNAGAAEAYGVELDAQMAVTSELSLSAGYAFLHARFVSYPNASVFTPAPAPPLGTGVGLVTTNLDLDGASLTRAPNHTVYGSGTYSFPVFADWKGSVTGLARYTSAYDFNPDAGGTLGLDAQKAYTLVNFTGFIGPGSERYKIGFYVNNAFNKLYYEFVNTGALGAYRGPAMPRTYGGNITVKF
jgi:iron complex outermembrane receptor protein